ncbi:MAG: NAD(P)-dependent oxidoreductase [Bradyrhizobium sp.]|nr:NAD(P)-dependent oxidoreductase [Bradyrhizobium sp.]
MTSWTIEDDFRAVDTAVGDQWQALKGARIFMTGGTGFIGRWMLETLRYADVARALGTEVIVLTRDPALFAAKAPHLTAHPTFSFLAGDVNDFAVPDGDFTHLIHAATDASAELNATNPRLMFDTVVNGTRRVLDFAVTKSIGRVLNMSSGAVYGRQPFELLNVPEDWAGAPDCTNPVNAYAEGKRAAEMLCAIYGKQFGLAISTARIFALLGPLLSLDIHFAAGNFIKDAIEDRRIVVKGNGLPVRSYLYIADLVSMLWHLLLRGAAGRAYNLGSDEGISIAELAERVARLIGRRGYEILGQADQGWNPGRYVPDTGLVRRELGLYKTISLDEAVCRTAMWNGWTQWR